MHTATTSIQKNKLKNRLLPLHSKKTTPANQKTSLRPLTAIIGLGYVGLPLALLAEKTGHPVVGFDIDPTKIASLRKREAQFLTPSETAQLKKSTLRLSNDYRILKDARIFILCVPTPVDHTHTPDLKPLQKASQVVAQNLKRGDLVIIESTVNPRVCRTVSLPILESGSGLMGEKDFYFAHCPERINPGDQTYTVETIPRVVGALGPKSLARATTFYQTLLRAPVVPMQSLEEAEAVKMVENSFRDINIAFVNELAMSFGKAGIDITNVIAGASTKPFSFMPHFPGCGVGGHCIPVDPYYLIGFGKENGFDHRFLVAAREINSNMPHYTVDLLEDALISRNISMRNARVTLLGLSYKRDIPDLRESPSLVIEERLKKYVAHVKTYDPHVPDLSTETTLETALHGADALVIATDHSLFRDLSPELLLRHGISIVIDGRNCLPKALFEAEGILYKGIGR